MWCNAVITPVPADTKFVVVELLMHAATTFPGHKQVKLSGLQRWLFMRCRKVKDCTDPATITVFKSSSIAAQSTFWNRTRISQEFLLATCLRQYPIRTRFSIETIDGSFSFPSIVMCVATDAGKPGSVATHIRRKIVFFRQVLCVLADACATPCDQATSRLNTCSPMPKFAFKLGTDSKMRTYVEATQHEDCFFHLISSHTNIRCATKFI